MLLHYGPTRTRLPTRSAPGADDPPSGCRQPPIWWLDSPRRNGVWMEAVILDFYGTLARAVSWGPLASELFARRGLPFDQPTWDHHRWDALDGLDHQEFSGSREAYEAWAVGRWGRARGA